MRLVTFRTIRELGYGPVGLGALATIRDDPREGRAELPRGSRGAGADRPFTVDGRPRLGIPATHVVPLGAIAALDVIPAVGAALASGDMAALLAADPGLTTTRSALEEIGLRSGDGPGPVDHQALDVEPLFDLADVRILAPVRRPGKVVCVGLNYRDHVAEQHIEAPPRPVLFAKFANALVGDGDPVVHHDATHALDLEAELAVVIGRRVRRVPAGEALGAVAGYMVANDVTARDLQGQRAALAPGERGDGQWLRAKGSDTFLPLGPALVSADEVPDPGRLAIRSWRTTVDQVAGGFAAGGAASGVTSGRSPDGSTGPAPHPIPMQSGTTADMIWSVPELLAFISAVITLEPGDVVLTGTPAGVGVFRDPPMFLVPGDVASVEIVGFGRLDNPIVAADGSAPRGSPAQMLLRALPPATD